MPAQRAWDEATLADEEASKLLKAKRYDDAHAAYKLAVPLFQKAAELQDGVGAKEL